jgi:hypothetical protein
MKGETGTAIIFIFAICAYYCIVDLILGFIKEHKKAKKKGIKS